MPDHEFDKALGEKASSLLVEPSPAVWEAVAARLKEKKRRRAIIWWFSAASLLCLSLGASWWWESNRSGQPTSTNLSDAKAVSSQAVDLAATAEAVAANENKIVTPKKNKTTDGITAPYTDASSDNTTTSANSTNTTRFKNTKANKKEAKENNKEVIANRAVTANSKDLTANKKNLTAARKTKKPDHLQRVQRASNNEQISLQQNAFLPHDASLFQDQAQRADRNKQKAAKDLTLNKVAAPYLSAYLFQTGSNTPNILAPTGKKTSQHLLHNPAPEVEIATAAGSEWAYALDLKMGYSSLQSGLFESFKSSTPEYQASYANPGANNISSLALPSNLTFVQRQPSTIKAGPAFQAQFQVSYPVSRKLRIGVGVQYSYSSNLIKFGDVVDSSTALVGNRFLVAMAAPPGTSAKNEDFTNSFHAVLFPVELSWNFDRNGRWFLNSGFSSGVLVGKNAFQFNSQSGYYYRDDKSFNTIQTALFTGIYYTVNPTAGLPISLGPVVQYNLNNNDNTGGNRKMLFLGLGTRLKLRQIR